MGERSNPSSSGIIPRKPLLCLFIFASTLFMLSWFFVLRFTGRAQFIKHSLLLPTSKIFSTNQDPNGSKRTPRVDRRCYESNSEILKVYMYDLPSQFHFELLGWKKSREDTVWPDIRTAIPMYPGGLNLQHSIEYWLTLDLLYSEFVPSLRDRRAIRVHNASEADVIFVPFFSSLSYNRYSKANPYLKSSTNKELQKKLVEYLTSQAEWKRSGGRDHVVLAHHPNSMLDARMQLWPSIFVLADFGRYPPRVANIDKDVIAPYMNLIKSYENDTGDFESRSTLLYFQGAIYRKDGGFVRQELFYLLKNEKDVHFSFGSIHNDGINKATQGMRDSKFCLNVAGDTPSSNRLFDAIASHCVPVIVSDAIELPFEDVLDYSQFCIFVKTSDAVKENFLIDLIRGISKDEWTRMWRRLKEVEGFFEFRYPSREGDAVYMIWKSIAQKVPAVKMKIHKSGRYDRYNSKDSSSEKKRSEVDMHMPKNFPV